jgi:hypothetical protein
LFVEVGGLESFEFIGWKTTENCINIYYDSKSAGNLAYLISQINAPPFITSPYKLSKKAEFEEFSFVLPR